MTTAKPAGDHRYRLGLKNGTFYGDIEGECRRLCVYSSAVQFSQHMWLMVIAVLTGDPLREIARNDNP
jgi:hypothetical protein